MTQIRVRIFMHIIYILQIQQYDVETHTLLTHVASLSSLFSFASCGKQYNASDFTSSATVLPLPQATCSYEMQRIVRPVINTGDTEDITDAINLVNQVQVCAPFPVALIALAYLVTNQEPRTPLSVIYLFSLCAVFIILRIMGVVLFLVLHVMHVLLIICTSLHL